MGRILVFSLVFSLGLASAQEVYKLRVRSWSCAYVGGAVVAQGVVENISKSRVQGLRVHLRLVEKGLQGVKGVSSNRVYGVNSAPIARPSLAPGEASPFSVRVPTRQREFSCQLWFRNASVVQIPTLVPRL
ncbi:MAG: hypothetical protein NZ849_07515 [Meiothermus sp.]|uniref:hypothetical protein n=1 Tax=Meiothermus sp. TaxID=1955249 RepID=UPI0025F07908|nr:hypothetical protein [Meiothermus sp.]MCS7058230.1 hypothetical protein [Meiothermus sp.]MCS7194741.1 hypothetical protein [Meiothermus sp.]MCX7739490.1 hypothetical protein [Meiothermus sp.]MDW8091406.1 hypothetical protein [Meiothermus sp.]MDW8481337.1 hypothetical protein [Meiothermus sp.]